MNIPEDWQSLSQSGLLAFYAAKELPKDEDSAFETLSVGVYTSSEAATEPVAPRLTRLLKARSKDRQWKESTFGTPTITRLGSRSGYRIDVQGVDSKSRSFAGTAVLVRTNEREVLVFAVSPQNEWRSHADEIADLFANWYWHIPPTNGTSDPKAAP